MIKRLFAAAVLVAGIATPVALVATPASAAPSLCITGSVTVNGTTQNINECLPPA